MKDDVSLLMRLYPLIYFACHMKFISDPVSGAKLTMHQASILDHLDMKEPVSLYHLAMHMGVSPSTMSVTVDRIIKLGYIAKEQSKEDARKLNLTLTKAGQELKKSKTMLDPERIEAMLNRLDPAERETALKGLALLADAAQQEMKNKSLEGSWNKRNH